MTHPAIINSEVLKELTGISQEAALRRALEKQGIKLFEGKKGPWTTVGLIELAGKPKQDDKDII